MSATIKRLALPRHPEARRVLSTLRADLAREERELAAWVRKRRERIETLRRLSERFRDHEPDYVMPDLLTVMVGLLEDLSLRQVGLMITVQRTAGWSALEPQPWPPADAHAVWHEIDPGAPVVLGSIPAEPAPSPDDTPTEDLGAWLVSLPIDDSPHGTN